MPAAVHTLTPLKTQLAAAVLMAKTTTAAIQTIIYLFSFICLPPHHVHYYYAFSIFNIRNLWYTLTKGDFYYEDKKTF